ncbi:MAG: alpha-mannosidase [Firmicutes bacterium]|nr:alpha-mannosidase [Bacillota bacterium]
MDFIYQKVRTLTDKMQSLMFLPPEPITGMEYQECGYKKGSTPPSDGYRPFAPDTLLSGRDSHFWFHLQFRTPDAQKGRTPFFRLITGKDGNWDATNPQAMIYIDGQLVQAIDVNHTMVQLESGRDIDMYLYLYMGMIDIPILLQAALVMRDDQTEKTYYDLKVPLDTLLVLNPNTEEYVETRKCLELAANELVLWPEYSAAYYKGMRAASRLMHDEFYNGICGKSDLIVNCIGHTHIDVAWKWTFAQTREKAQRSFATVLELMKHYPDYLFMSSQPQLFAYVKEEDPELFERIREAVKAGRFEMEGAMWLEADCNLTSGESFIRQILHGKKFMRDEFGVESRTLWLPDVFGYSAALPQILKKCGVDTFVTSKISWNEMNTVPYDTFLWQGIDGTEIFTNFMTAQNAKPNAEIENFTTYNGDITPSQVLGTWNRYQQKEYSHQTAITFGYGDGGGGPTREMLERYERLKYGLPGLPRAHMATSREWTEAVRREFEAATKRLKRTPRWVGELYMEMHRGTYTSIGRNKRNNRKSEQALQQAEILCATDGLLTGGPSCHDELYKAWETVLLNQFHDVLPGSSIFEVYEDTDKSYAEVFKTANSVIEARLDSIVPRVAAGLDAGLGKEDADVAAAADVLAGDVPAPDVPAPDVPAGDRYFVYNPLGFARKAQIATPEGTVETAPIPAFGWTIVTAGEPDCKVRLRGRKAETPFYSIQLDAAGRIEKLYDKRADRDVLLAGACGNEIQVFEDFPRAYDDWEITNYYKQKETILDKRAEITPLHDGSRAGWQIRRKFLSSEICQKLWLYSDNPRIDFETEIDWHEQHMLVKAAFPLDVHASEGTYEIQFGNLKRPTHENTSWDAAKFEVCAHKWADLSEYGYGASILSDCKYGFNAEGSTLKITMLKCGTDPNPLADQGRHVFTYSLLPHLGDYRCGTVQEAYCLNIPAIARPLEPVGEELEDLLALDGADQDGTLPEGFSDDLAGTLPATFSLLSVDKENVIPETVKPAEDGEGIIVRLYDAYDMRTTTTLRAGFPFHKAWICDMLENREVELPIAADGTISFPVKNFEIVTLRLE